MADRDVADGVEVFFDGAPRALALYKAVAGMVDSVGAAHVRVTKSQIAFRRQKGFAYLWRPDRYLKTDVPAVLSIALPEQIDSDRFKEVAHPSPGVWMHHLELRSVAQLDAQVRDWLALAYTSAA